MSTQRKRLTQRAPLAVLLLLVSATVLLGAGAPAIGATETSTQDVESGVWPRASLASLAGGAVDWCTDIAVDSSGNRYVCGYTASIDFPTTDSAYQESYRGGISDAFVARVGTDGVVDWCTYLGGELGDYAFGVAVRDGVVAVVGYSEYVTLPGDSFPTTSGAYDESHNGNFDAFVSLLAASDGTLEYSTLLGGTLSDYAYAVALDSHGTAWVTGKTLSPDFPMEGTAMNSTLGGSVSAYIAAVNATGCNYTTYIGGDGEDECRSIKVVNSSLSEHVSIVVAGLTTSGSGMPVTASAYKGQLGTTRSSFVAIHRVASWSGLIDYCTYLGGEAGTEMYEFPAVAYRSGAIGVATTSSSSEYLVTAGAAQLTVAGQDDIWVGWLDPSESGAAQLVGATWWGGEDDDRAYDCQFDSSGRLVVAGSTKSPDYPSLGRRSRGRSGASSRDVALARFEPASNYEANATWSTAHSLATWSNAWALGIEQSSQDPVVCGQHSPGTDLSQQQGFTGVVRIPDNPDLALETVSAANKTTQTLRVTANATAANSLSGSEVDHVSLYVYQPVSGDVAEEAASVIDDAVPELYEVEHVLNESGLTRWALVAYSLDGGSTLVEREVDVEGGAGAAETTSDLQDLVSSSGWYVWVFAWAAVALAMALLTALPGVGPTGRVVSYLALAAGAGFHLALGAEWPIEARALVWGIVAAWAIVVGLPDETLPLQRRLQAFAGFTTAAFITLSVWTVLSAGLTAWFWLFAAVGVGGLVVTLLSIWGPKWITYAASSISGIAGALSIANLFGWISL